MSQFMTVLSSAKLPAYQLDSQFRDYELGWYKETNCLIELVSSQNRRAHSSKPPLICGTVLSFPSPRKPASPGPITFT